MTRTAAPAPAPIAVAHAPPSGAWGKLSRASFTPATLIFIDVIVLALIGACAIWRQSVLLSFANAYAARFLGESPLVVVKSDTSMLLLRLWGSQCLAVAFAMLASTMSTTLDSERAGLNDTTSNHATYHVIQAAALGVARTLGGPSHALLVPLIAWHAAATVAYILSSRHDLVLKLGRKLGAAAHLS